MTDWALYLKMKIQNWLKLKKRSCCVGRMSNHVTGSCLLRASSPLDLLNWFRFSLFQFSYSKNWDFDQKTISKHTGTLKTIKKDFQWILFFFSIWVLYLRTKARNSRRFHKFSIILTHEHTAEKFAAEKYCSNSIKFTMSQSYCVLCKR